MRDPLTDALKKMPIIKALADTYGEIDDLAWQRIAAEVRLAVAHAEIVAAKTRTKEKRLE